MDFHGGSGISGSHLRGPLLAEVHEVICLNRLTAGRKENIQPLFAHTPFNFLRSDVARPIDFGACWQALRTGPPHDGEPVVP